MLDFNPVEKSAPLAQVMLLILTERLHKPYKKSKSSTSGDFRDEASHQLLSFPSR